jgi:hypothetical protein
VQVKYSGQGRGRTADLPTFKTMVMHSYSIATVPDLRRKIHAVIGERRRTNANETEIETARERNRLRPHPQTGATATYPAHPAVTPAARRRPHAHHQRHEAKPEMPASISSG